MGYWQVWQRCQGIFYWLYYTPFSCTRLLGDRITRIFIWSWIFSLNCLYITVVEDVCSSITEFCCSLVLHLHDYYSVIYVALPTHLPYALSSHTVIDKFTSIEGSPNLVNELPVSVFKQRGTMVPHLFYIFHFSQKVHSQKLKCKAKRRCKRFNMNVQASIQVIYCCCHLWYLFTWFQGIAGRWLVNGRLWIRISKRVIHIVFVLPFDVICHSVRPCVRGNKGTVFS